MYLNIEQSDFKINDDLSPFNHCFIEEIEIHNYIIKSIFKKELIIKVSLSILDYFRRIKKQSQILI